MKKVKTSLHIVKDSVLDVIKFVVDFRQVEQSAEINVIAQ